ncbi:unnamed protein product [Lymnaea stagnalis]|uniref:Uncharacterized protein n=1 Tax=Lymnaea stagnalis TaxID=6523 RepID=A0AAV2HP02_LYMST
MASIGDAAVSRKSYSSSDKKSDEKPEVTQPAGGFLWRMSSGLFNTATGAVGYGVGGVKWVAGKTIDVGSAVAHKTMDAGAVVASKLPLPSVSVPFVTKKDKKE